MENLPKGTKAILLDIIGTTTPDSFVKRTLPDYALEKLYGFLERFHSIPDVKSTLANLKRMHSEDARAGEEPPAWDSHDLESDLRCIVDYCAWLMEKDSNPPPLKYLEDFLWEEGYRSGSLHGEVYADVPDALAKWKALGLDICTYSSDSVFSQQLIFGSTKYGNLMPLIRGYFDTSVGTKEKPESYVHIAGILGVRPSQIVYFSRNRAELKAARKAGMAVILMERDRSLGGREEGMEAVSDFSGFTRLSIDP